MNTRAIRDLVSEQPVFAGLPHGDIDLIAGCGHNVHFPAGVLILEEGRPADAFYVVRAGKVALEIHSPHRGPRLLETLGAGEVLGWSWLFPPYVWQMDARAVDPVDAVALDALCLRGKCDDDPRLGYELMKRFTQIVESRLHAARLRLVDLYDHDTAG